MPKPSVNQTREGPSVHPTMSLALLVQVGAIPGCPEACPLGFSVLLIARGVSRSSVGCTAGLLPERRSALCGMASPPDHVHGANSRKVVSGAARFRTRVHCSD